MFSNSPYLRPLADIQNPVRTLMYEENIGRWAWACKNELSICSFIGDGVDPGPMRTLRGWHRKAWTYNRAFADAHAETQQIFIPGTEDSFGYANHYRNEFVENLPQYPGDPGLSDNDELNERYRCIIIRDDAWQKDSFPAELLPTDFTWSGGGRPSYENCVESARARTAVGARPK